MLSDSKSRDVRLQNGRRISAIEAGDGMPLLLMHGIGSNARSWGPLLPLLAQTFRVIAWDMPGYGGSDPLPEKEPGPAEYGRVCADFLAALGIGRAAFIGHSLGAQVVIEFSAQTPQTVAALIVSAPALGSACQRGATWPDNVRSRLIELEKVGAAEFARLRAPRLCAEGSPRSVIQPVEEAMAEVRLPGYAQACSLLAQGDLLSRVRTLTIAGLVIGGGKDRIVPAEKARALAAAWPGARYVEIDTVGHAPYVENPQAYAAPILSYLNEIVR
jgi:pimeloyl-ACP methyl ester carboxylesterase